jgi:Tol biopolymer transport system component
MPATLIPTRATPVLGAALLCLLAACGGGSADTPSDTSASADSAPVSTAALEAEEQQYFTNLRQLTFGGENAEAYWSADGQYITFQSTRDGRTCDQQYVMRADGSDVTKISAGGKTTCGYFYNGDSRVFFAATHHADTACPPRPDPSAGYVWPLDPYDIYTVNPDGTDLQRLTNFGVYTAEGILSPDGKKIVFTSLKDGDLDIYTMNVDGTDVKRLTNTRGYDGGPWWSPDGTKIVYRAHHPTDSTELAQYDELLAKNMIRPSKVELFVMNADGSDNRQITQLGGANFGPTWTPDGSRIIFSSNHENPRSRDFNLYLVNLDGTGLVKLTTHPEFDGFPMFSPDGTKLIWASNRGAKEEGETNVFVADWIGR